MIKFETKLRQIGEDLWIPVPELKHKNGKLAKNGERVMVSLVLEETEEAGLEGYSVAELEEVGQESRTNVRRTDRTEGKRDYSKERRTYPR